MALIEVDTDVWYNTEMPWYEQSEDCIALGQVTMQGTPTSITNEPCLGGAERMLNGTWQTTTATGTFDMDVTCHYEYPAMSRGYLAKVQHDTITVTQV